MPNREKKQGFDVEIQGKITGEWKFHTWRHTKEDAKLAEKELIGWGATTRITAKAR